MITPRTPAQILAAFQASVALSDPSMDATKGPLLSVVGLPLAETLSPTEQDVANLEALYSVDFAKTADDNDAQAFLNNWGASPGDGSNSIVTVFFMTFSAPTQGQLITINVGDVVGNNNQSYQFSVVTGGVINGNNANSYFNPRRRAYEIPLFCRAVAPGPQYDLPAGLINTKVSQIVGIDAVENRVAAQGGVAAETPQQQVSRVQKQFLGTAINTASGGYTRVRDVNPSIIQDVQIVTSGDRLLFRRIIYTPGIDYYIIGFLPTNIGESYTSQTGGETLIPLQHVPTFAITAVEINNVPITGFSLVKDTSLAYGGSAQAQDMLQLPVSLLANDVVQINLTFNSIIQTVQQTIFTGPELFYTSELAREPFQVPILIKMTGRALPGYDPTTIQSELATQLQTLIEPGVWQGTFQPEVIRENLSVLVPGLTSLTIQQFQRSTLATSPVETVLIAKNELAEYDPTVVQLIIKT